ncbi:MAG: GNAT family N-acetyltransferase [Syntrophorhabdaceae bacterium]|nr:GNAT family N-acetyltransferase [Syntrophorhabdaceae bacterium]
MRVIDVHIHVGHRSEWTEGAKKVWMDTGPYVPEIFDAKERQLPQEYGDAIKEEGVFGGILIPEYSPLTAGVMPFERAVEINRLHPELIPIANININYHSSPMEAFGEQLKGGAKGLKIHPIHGFFYANDQRLYPLYKRCEDEGLPVLFHAGTTLFKGAKMRYADPYTFDDVISDFPEMKIILCHGGRGFWYHIAEFMVKSFKNVYIDVSGLPPQNLIKYFPSMKRFPHKYLFGSDFPGVPGIRKNYTTLQELLKDEEMVEKICFSNAYNLFGFWKEGLFEVKDRDEIFGVIDDGSKVYKGLIPEDRYHEPYMPMDELDKEMERMRFYGYRKDLKLLGVMAKERVKDMTLIRHAYVRRDSTGQGIGSKLLSFIEKGVETEWLLVGTWEANKRAIEFYKKNGFTIMDNKDDLLRKYWDIPIRQIETSCVLGKRIKK